ncbi:adenylate/guanylate cyclase domain-containing protein [Rufibacter sp. LB8]|uniref:adenylate/guanylate cyclase domain-containing protein n=1 Tax=Rufibacter sp. LB8 TaxID=2777781 RepID=UPI00178C418C|nr:adenylate/guanylate cyclase domain-containing protein [Rufibacter sp. LB8]
MKKDVIEEIENWVKELLNPSLPFTPQDGRAVPTIEHQHLTVNAKTDLRAVRINACVMHIDLRDSTKFNELYNPDITSKVYTAFVRMVLQCASEHNGSVRNIVGDRVMIIFVGDGCFKNSVDCAVSCNSLLEKLQSSFISLLGNNFTIKAGIGIDYGEMHVVLVGITQRGKEGLNNQDLVWLGQPANVASKLTDNAGKTYSVFNKVEEKIKTVKKTHPSILITENVFQGLINTQPNRFSLVNKLWNQNKLTVGGNAITIFGASLVWTYNN